MVHVDVKSVILGGRTARTTSVAASTVSDDPRASPRSQARDLLKT